MEALSDALNLSYAYAQKKMKIHRLLRTYADSPHIEIDRVIEKLH